MNRVIIEMMSIFAWGLIPFLGLIFIPQTLGYLVCLYNESGKKVRRKIGYWDADNWAIGFLVSVLIGACIGLIMLFGVTMKAIFGISPFN